MSSAAPAAVRDCFARFVAAQNARDAVAVAALLRESPDFLWVTTTADPVWGHHAAMVRFRRNWEGTWELRPAPDTLRVVELSPEVAVLHCSILSRFAPPGEPATPALVRWNGVFLRDAAGWRIASIMLASVPVA